MIHHTLHDSHVGLRVILCEHDPLVRPVLASVLAAAGIDAVEAKNANHVIELAREDRLQAVLLDLDLPQRDAPATARVLKKNPQTASVPVVVLCEATADKDTLKEMIGYGISGVLIKPIKPELMLHKLYELADKQLHSLTDSKEKSPFATVHLEENPSLLVRQVQCPFHEKQLPFYYYILRAGKMGAEMTFFDIPRFTEPAKGCQPVNYNLLSVICCPVCHFASNNPDYFKHPGAPNAPQAEFDAATVAEVMGKSEERRKLLGQVQADYYTSRRSVPAAITAYRVAIESSRILHECNEHNFAIELSRMGNYHLRIALLMEDQKQSAEKIDVEIKAAHEWFKQSYMFVHGPAFFRNAYQIAATGIWLGDDKTAYTYIQRLRDVEREKEKEMSPQSKAALGRYLSQAQRAWEDRDMHRSPIAPKPEEVTEEAPQA